jgi:signal transduction histidine kinase
MRLIYRLLLFSMALVIILTVFVMLIVDMRLRDNIVNERASELQREAEIIGAEWDVGANPQDVAARAAQALGGRVTFVDPSGRIVGDAATASFTAATIGDKATRPEIALAAADKPAIIIEPDKGDGSSDIYVAQKSKRGIVRIGVEMSTLDRIFDRARRDVLTSGFVALLWAGLFSVVFARYVSRPIGQLRDMARALARREFEGQADVHAPGEVGDLAESLKQLSARLQALEGLRREFIVNVSHELSSPLTIASGFAATLARHDPPAESRKQFARAILSNTHRMQRVIDDMLDLSRIETGSWVPRVDQVLLRDEINEIFNAVGPAAQQKNIKLRCEVDDRAAIIRADPTWVRQILGNLIENALRHTVRGEIVAFATQTHEGTTIGVRDTGEGIAPYHLPRIFERLYRADTGRARPSGGSGLGLAIVKHMVEAHGGHVHAESTVGVGTVITAFFPKALPAHRMRTPRENKRLPLEKSVAAI